MNTLLLSSNPDPKGVEVMIHAIQTVLRETPTVLLSGLPAAIDLYHSGASSVMPDDLSDFQPSELEDASPRGFILPRGTLSDCVDLAFLRSDLFLPEGVSWDRVFIGLEHGAATGIPDTLRHTGTASGLLAATAYGAPTHVLTRVPAPDDHEHDETERYANAWTQAEQSLRQIRPEPGEVILTHILPTNPAGAREAPLHHYSAFRTPSTALVPRARTEDSARNSVASGFLTHSVLRLRLNPELRY